MDQLAARSVRHTVVGNNEIHQYHSSTTYLEVNALLLKTETTLFPHKQAFSFPKPPIWLDMQLSRLTV